MVSLRDETVFFLVIGVGKVLVNLSIYRLTGLKFDDYPKEWLQTLFPTTQHYIVKCICFCWTHSNNKLTSCCGLSNARTSFLGSIVVLLLFLNECGAQSKCFRNPLSEHQTPIKKLVAFHSFQKQAPSISLTLALLSMIIV